MKPILINHFDMKWTVSKDVFGALWYEGSENVVSQGTSLMSVWLTSDDNALGLRTYDVVVGEESDHHSLQCDCYWCRDGYLTYPRVRLIRVAHSLLSFQTREKEVITIRG